MQKEGPAAGQSWNVLGGFSLYLGSRWRVGEWVTLAYNALPPWLPWASLGEANRADGVKGREGRAP